MSTSIRKVKNTTRTSSIKKILQNEGKRVRLILLLAGFLLIFFGFSLPENSSKRENNKVLVNNVVQKEPIDIDQSFLKERRKKEKDASPPIKLVIPSLSIDIPVKEAKVVNGYWELFEDTAGWGAGSAYPGEVGNQVIFAHAREGLFLPLKKARQGQKIIVFTKDKWFEYKINEIKEVIPTQTEVIAPTTDETLTLYTCSGFSDSKRLIVIAKRVLE